MRPAQLTERLAVHQVYQASIGMFALLVMVEAFLPVSDAAGTLLRA